MRPSSEYGVQDRLSNEEDAVGEIDDGARCAVHVGEVFPPRCTECDALREERAPDVWEPIAEFDSDALPFAS